MNPSQLISSKTFAARLDCSLSMLYALRKSDPDFPRPAVKLFDKSERGSRWTEEQVAVYIFSKSAGAIFETEEPAPPFKRVELSIINGAGRTNKKAEAV